MDPCDFGSMLASRTKDAQAPAPPSPHQRFPPGVEPNVGLYQEEGWPGAFQSQPPGTLLDAGKTGLIRSLVAAPLLGGLSEDPISGAVTGAGAAMGSSFGQMGGEALAKALQASPNANSALNLGGGLAGAIAGGYLASKLRPKREKLAEDIRDMSSAGVFHDIHKQLPKIRLTESLAGGGLGALGGLLVDALRSKPADPEEAAKRRLRSILLGAGLGGAAANIGSDRARRYISNTLVPMGYDDHGDEVKPSWKRIFEAGIKDKPQYSRADSPDVKLRHELLRRQLGVHTDNPQTDLWARNNDGSYSINPQNPGQAELVRRILLARLAETTTAAGLPAALAAAQFNGSSAMGAITGGQRVSMIPDPDTNSNPAAVPRSGTLRVLDRWDYTLNPGEQSFMRGVPGNLLRHGLGWLKKPVDPATAPTIDYHRPDMTNRQAVGELGTRGALDFLSDENPWVSQFIRYHQPEGAPALTLTPLTGEGRAYPKPK